MRRVRHVCQPDFACDGRSRSLSSGPASWAARRRSRWPAGASRSSLLEAEPEPGLAASGTNSGILHTGFDSRPGELETELILRSAALRDPVLEALGVPVLRCGALHAPAERRSASRGGARRERASATASRSCCATTARSRCRARR